MTYHPRHDRGFRHGYQSWLTGPVWPFWGGPYLPISPEESSGGYEEASGSEEGLPYAETQKYGVEPQPLDDRWASDAEVKSRNYHSQVNALPLVENPVTVVFKDGRPAERIHNYLMTARMLSVLDGYRREIPVDEIDMTATAKVNREAGVDFMVPGSSP